MLNNTPPPEKKEKSTKKIIQLTNFVVVYFVFNCMKNFQIVLSLFSFISDTMCVNTVHINVYLTRKTLYQNWF